MAHTEAKQGAAACRSDAYLQDRCVELHGCWQFRNLVSERVAVTRCPARWCYSPPVTCAMDRVRKEGG